MSQSEGKQRKERPPGAGRSGVAPPREYRWKPGQSGNPKGRPSAGLTLRQWIDHLAAQDCTEAQLRKVARDTRAPWPKRAAAERILRTLEYGDLADLEPLLRGEKSLEELREAGINTEVVKKCKVKSRVTAEGDEIIEREIELHDRAGEDFDRICDRTSGKPTQAIEMD